MFAVDAGSTQGVGEVMQQFNLPAKGVHAGGYDLLPKTLQLIHAGFLDFTIDQQAYLQGFYTAMEMFMFLASGGLTGPADINTGLKFVTKGSVGPYLGSKTRYEGIVRQAGDRQALRPDQRLIACRNRSAPGCGSCSCSWQEASILVVALLLIGYFEAANRDFLLSGASLENLSQFIAPAAIIACGEIMLMICGEIDLSAGMVFAMAPFIMYFAADAGVPAPLALVAGVAAAALVGLVNGLVTVKLAVPSFVTTLGTLFLVNGFTLTISPGTPVEPPGGAALAQVMGAWGYSEILWALGIAAVMHVVLRHTRWGLHTIGRRRKPDRRGEAGIAVERLKIGNFVLCGALAGLTGMLEAFRISSIDPQAGGNQIMFLAVAAGVIGGTPLAGGSGTIIGGLIGAGVLGVLSDGFTLIGINAFTFNIILGVAILLAMIFNIHIVRLARSGKAE